MNKHIEEHVEEAILILNKNVKFLDSSDSVKKDVVQALTAMYQQGVSDTLEKIQSGPAFIVPKSPIH